MFASLLKRIGVTLNLNDNRWGRNPDRDSKAQEGKRPDGPPDLDQLWRDFNNRLSRLFGQRTGGGGGDGPRGDMKGAGITAAVVAVIILFIWLASGAFIVQEGQVGVVTTFGKVSHIARPGFNWRWPYPFQSNEIVNVSSVRNVEIGYRGGVRNKEARESLMLTDDENIIDIQFAVQYTLKDPVAWLFNNKEPEENVKQVAETAMREVVGRSQMNFVLYEGREKVARDVHALMQQIFQSTSKVMVDAKSGSNLLYLPLDKLVAQTIANDTAARAVAQQQAAQQAPQTTQETIPTVDVHSSRANAREREGR
jgi:membrane protease subunit HflK